jgi:hypothetical protein
LEGPPEEPWLEHVKPKPTSRRTEWKHRSRMINPVLTWQCTAARCYWPKHVLRSASHYTSSSSSLHGFARVHPRCCIMKPLGSFRNRCHLQLHMSHGTSGAPRSHVIPSKLIRLSKRGSGHTPITLMPLQMQKENNSNTKQICMRSNTCVKGPDQASVNKHQSQMQKCPLWLEEGHGSYRPRL